MAAAIGEKGGPMRVFVLVDKGESRGVFISWDAAEEYANNHRLSLDNLHEFITRHDHPEHLHLLSAMWDDVWEFHGEWKRETPRWKRPPRKVRLDHYHLKRNQFQILRQKEFNWSTGLLLKIDPMAPEMILDQVGSQQRVSKAKQWRPKLGALKSAPPPGTRTATPWPTPSSGIPEEATAHIPLIPEPEPPIEAIKEKAHKPKDQPTIKPALQRAPELKPKLATETGKKSPALDKSGTLPLEDKAKITFPKRKPLKLKGKDIPKPIPEFTATAPPPELPSHKSSVELAHQDKLSEKDASSESGEGSKRRRIMPMRLVLAILAVILCWSGGVFWVFRPQPTAEEFVTSVVALNRATKIIIEPGQIFFQLPVDPIHQQRYVQSLEMEPIRRETIFPMPTHHALDTWSKPDGFVRPPYADIEVREWWDLRLRNIQHGFTMEWDDGSILILDLESDMLIGWMYAKHLQSVLN